MCTKYAMDNKNPNFVKNIQGVRSFNTRINFAILFIHNYFILWLQWNKIPSTKEFPLFLLQVQKIIREKIQDNWTGFTRAFLKIDLNQDGLLSKSELAELLDRYSIPMDQESFDKWVISIYKEIGDLYYIYTANLQRFLNVKTTFCVG